MNVLFQGLKALPFLLLLACNGSGHTDETDGDTDDTDVTPTGTAKVTYTSYQLGVPEPCTITYACDTGIFTASSGEEIEIPAPSDCTIEAGLPALKAQFGYNTHEDVEGEYWADEVQQRSFKVDEVYDDGRFDLHKVFLPGDYACSRDSYQYDALAPDFKGDFVRTVEIDVQWISVTQEGVIVPLDDPGMGVMDDVGDSFQVTDDYLEVFEPADPDGLFVVDDSSMIGFDHYGATVVFPEIATNDLWCNLDG